MSASPEVEAPRLPGLAFVRRIGTGGYAEVFLYEQVNTHMRVAVKVLFKESLTDRMREQFSAEANAMAELADHPNIVQVFQADVTDDGRPYLVMKYYPQRNLAVRAAIERLTVPEVLRIGVRIACAVETAHRAGILHRDIKPANILTSQYGEPGLADFGIATRSTGGAEEESQGLSIPWSAPEVVFATSPGDRTADVYSLGATLWHLLGGHSPFEIPGGDNTTPSLMRRIRETPVPRTGRDDVPASLERLLAQSMAKNAGDRPQTALQLARSLQGIETAQGWVPTPLVLLEVGPEADDPAPGDDVLPDDPATRRRQPRAVAAQPAARPDPGNFAVVTDGASVTPGAEPTTVRRPTAHRGSAPVLPAPATPGARPARPRHMTFQGAPESATVRRPTAPAPSAQPPLLDDDAPPSTRPGGGRWKLAALSAVVAAAVVATAVALVAHGGSGSSAATTTTTAGGTAPTIALASLSPPAVTGARLDASSVKFTWSETDHKAGERFYWKEPGGPPHAAGGDSVTLPAPGGRRVCVQVEVVLGQAYADSGVTCAR